MLDLARHIVEQKSGSFEPAKFEDQYETALVELINQKRAGKPITPKERPRGENVVDLMEALRRSVGGGSMAAETHAPKKSGKKPRKPAAGQKEMLMPIAGLRYAKIPLRKKVNNLPLAIVAANRLPQCVDADDRRYILKGILEARSLADELQRIADSLGEPGT